MTPGVVAGVEIEESRPGAAVRRCHDPTAVVVPVDLDIGGSAPDLSPRRRGPAIPAGPGSSERAEAARSKRATSGPYAGGMRRTFVVVLGLLMLAVGVVWTFQGLGVIGGSAMSGVEVWAVVGPLVAGFGVALAFVGARRRQ
jgi:hypothetical protein